MCVVTTITVSPTRSKYIKGAVTLNNLSDEPRPYLVLLALYDGTTMLNVRNVKGTLAAGGTLPVVTGAMPVGKEGCTAKVMVWESWVNIMPKASAYIIPQAN